MAVSSGRQGSGSRYRSENPLTVRFSSGSATHSFRGVSEDCPPKGKTDEGARPRYFSVHHGLQPNPAGEVYTVPAVEDELLRGTMTQLRFHVNKEKGKVI